MLILGRLINMQIFIYLVLSFLLLGCASNPHFKPTKMYAGNQNKTEADFSLIYIDWMESSIVYKGVGQTAITEINNVKVEERVSSFGSRYLFQVLPGEQKISIFLYIFKNYIGMDYYKTEQVNLKLDAFNTEPNKIYVLCPQKGNDIKFNVNIYPYTREEILKNKGMTDFIVRPCRTMNNLLVR
jgi:hypothetical protein